MIKLNLLPPHQRDYLKYERTYLYLRTVVFMILTFTIITSTFVLGAKLILQDNFSELLASSTRLNDKNQTVDRQVAQLNHTLQGAERIQADFIKWSNVIIGLTAAIPGNVQLSYLNVDRSTKVLTLSGLAQRREDYLELEANLKMLPYLELPETPLANILQRTDVKFDIRATLKPEAITSSL